VRPDVVAGRFALCDPLARGAAGTVWRAWDLRREAYCAAKVMRQRDAADPLRFAREQGVRLTHPHLLTPYSWAAEDEYVVIASPLVAGGSAHTVLGDYGPLSAELVADLLDQLLDGLEHVHDAGLVHRDVTLANMLMDATDGGRPHLRLADFGLAVRIGDPRLTRLGTVVGTPGYVPPETLAGAAPAPAADLYAAGQAAAALLMGAELDAPDRCPDLGGVGPGPLREVVAALVRPDPRERPGSAAEARQALGPVRPASRPVTAAGEPVVILVQLPELPPGWTPAGPGQPGPPPDGAAVRPPQLARDRVTGTQPDRPAPRPAAETAAPPGGRRWTARRAVAAGAAAAAVVVPLGLALLADRSSGGPGPTGTPSGTPSGSPMVTGPAAAGGPCGWQQEGDATTGADGRALVCVRTADGYRWQLS
jgi:eukaryotic-like serine/threonine-protein kinase